MSSRDISLVVEARGFDCDPRERAVACGAAVSVLLLATENPRLLLQNLCLHANSTAEKRSQRKTQSFRSGRARFSKKLPLWADLRSRLTPTARLAESVEIRGPEAKFESPERT